MEKIPDENALVIQQEAMALIDEKRINDRVLIHNQWLIDMGKDDRKRPFITHDGLVFLAHRRGLVKSDPPITELHNCKEMGCPKGSEESPYFITKVTLHFRDGFEVTMEGDACPHNTTSMLRASLRRMSETRAWNRAARIATNCGYCSFEELPQKEESLPHVLESTAKVVQDVAEKSKEKELKESEAVKSDGYTFKGNLLKDKSVIVVNPEGKEYQVVRFEDGKVQCSCPQNTMKGAICKHIIMVDAERARPLKAKALLETQKRITDAGIKYGDYQLWKTKGGEIGIEEMTVPEIRSLWTGELADKNLKKTKASVESFIKEATERR